MENGQLLDAAETAGFAYRQNLAGRRIAIVVLGQGRWSKIKPHVPQIVATVNAAFPGSFTQVEILYT